jgi:ATP-dependent RNA helicase DeaD
MNNKPTDKKATTKKILEQLQKSKEKAETKAAKRAAYEAKTGEVAPVKRAKKAPATKAPATEAPTADASATEPATETQPVEAPQVLAAAPQVTEATPEEVSSEEAAFADLPVEEAAPKAPEEAPQVLAPTPEAPAEAVAAAVAPEEAAPVEAASAEPESKKQETVEAAKPGLNAFAALGLSEPLARAVSDLGFEAPTPIQERSIPILLSGRDLIGQAQTGTGKTAAFALPLIQKIDPTLPVTQALVLAPTRELAVQVAGGIHDLAKHTRINVVPVFGGQPIDRQFRALSRGAHIVVGTPGRVQDHLRRGSLTLDRVSVCVLDEADEMLALGFLEDMEAILALLPGSRQLAFFSATMPPRIAALTKKFLRNAEHVSIESKRRTVDATNQTYYEVPRGKKLEALARVLDMETPGPTIVFCRTRQETNDLAEALQLRGYGAEPLHGDMNQNERDRVLRRFREGAADMLVATDVAARGLDIETVTHVINYDIPWDVEQYIHRIGRTGRAGRTGDAITLVEGRDRRQLKFIERAIGTQIKPARIPTAADIAARRRDVFKESLRQTLEAGAFDGHLSIVEELAEDFDAAEVAAAALQMLWQAQHANSNPADMAEEMAADGEQPEAGMARLFVGLGRQDNLRPGDLVGAITGEAGLTGQQIGAIDILDRTAFVEVPSNFADRVVTALSRTKLRGKKVKVQIAQPFDRNR